LALYDHSRLMAWRKDAGLRREDVCVATGLSYGWLARLEGGYGKHAPALATLDKLARFYGHDVRELFAPPAPAPAEVAS
jgi:transcriptional regulator with XRE-family HTH domain